MEVGSTADSIVSGKSSIMKGGSASFSSSPRDGPPEGTLNLLDAEKKEVKGFKRRFAKEVGWEGERSEIWMSLASSPSLSPH